MSVVFVILGFVLICLVLVHVNLHQKKNELYKFIKKVYKTLLVRHKKISKILMLISESEQARELKELNENTMKSIENNELSPSQRVRVEVLIEDRMSKLIKSLEAKEMSEDLKAAIGSYKRTQRRVDKNKTTYNEMIQEFLEACNIKPAAWYTAFEKIDTDYPRLLAQSE